MDEDLTSRSWATSLQSLSCISRMRLTCCNGTALRLRRHSRPRLAGRCSPAASDSGGAGVGTGADGPACTATSYNRFFLLVSCWSTHITHHVQQRHPPRLRVHFLHEGAPPQWKGLGPVQVESVTVQDVELILQVGGRSPNAFVVNNNHTWYANMQFIIITWKENAYVWQIVKNSHWPLRYGSKLLVPGGSIAWIAIKGRKRLHGFKNDTFVFRFDDIVDAVSFV